MPDGVEALPRAEKRGRVELRSRSRITGSALAGAQLATFMEQKGKIDAMMQHALETGETRIANAVIAPEAIEAAVEAAAPVQTAALRPAPKGR